MLGMSFSWTRQYTHNPETQPQIILFLFGLKKSWKVPNIIIFFCHFFENLIVEDKFEGMIVSIDKEIITTYDLSQRIKLASNL